MAAEASVSRARRQLGKRVVAGVDVVGLFYFSAQICLMSVRLVTMMSFAVSVAVCRTLVSWVELTRSQTFTVCVNSPAPLCL